MYIYRYIHIFVTLPKLNLAPAKMVIGGKLRSFWGHLLRGQLAVIPVGGGAGGESSTSARVPNSDDFHILGDIHEPNDGGLCNHFFSGFPILDDDSHSQGPPCNISKTPR